MSCFTSCPSSMLLPSTHCGHRLDIAGVGGDEVAELGRVALHAVLHVQPAHFELHTRLCSLNVSSRSQCRNSQHGEVETRASKGR